MDDLLQRLEHHIKNLIDQYDQLQRSHTQLNQGGFLPLQEKERLLAKQKKAILQIEALVSRLKSIGKLSS